jgi:hypothetical protein
MTTSDAHRAPLQSIEQQLLTRLVALRKLLPTVGQAPVALAACFGRKSKKRTDQITAILATLKALGLIA